MKFCIEDAAAADLEALAGLLHELFTQETEFSPDRDKQLRALAMFIDEPSLGRLFVARDLALGRIIGMASLQFEISTALGGRAARVEDVVVTASQRGRGIGKQLLQHLIAFARDEGLLRLSLLTDHDNLTAQGLYARFGFIRSPMIPMRLVLDTGSAKPRNPLPLDGGRLGRG